MMSWLPALLLAGALGLGVLRTTCGAWRARPRWAGWMGETAAGFVLGLGLTALLHVALLWLGIGGRALLYAVEGVAAAALLWVGARRQAPPEQEAAGTRAFGWNWALALAVVISATLFLLSFQQSARANPQGEREAWSLWNLEARFLAGGPAVWRNVLGLPPTESTASQSSWLLPASTARLWVFAREVNDTAPLLLARLFPLLAVALLAGALARARSLAAGWLAALVLFLSADYFGQAGAQSANVPASVFVLLTAALLLRASENTWDGGTLLAAGLAAGCAANAELTGLWFTLAAGLLLVWHAPRRRAAWFWAGAAPGLALCLAVRIALGWPRMDAFSAGRSVDVVISFGGVLLSLGFPFTQPLAALVLLGVLLRFRPAEERSAYRWLGWPLAAALAAGLLRLLFLPKATGDELTSAAEHLIAHLWPAALLGFFLLLRRPEDWIVTARTKR